MAKIVRFHETGGPEVLRVEDGDPGEPKAGEVLLHIEAVGVNRGEAAFRGGHYIVKPSFPSRIGSEASGRIAKLGAGVEGWAVGDAVFTLSTFPVGAYGVYASEAVVPASCLVQRPRWLDPLQSAATWVAFLTAWGGMVETGKLVSGEFVIIPAASSGAPASLRFHTETPMRTQNTPPSGAMWRTSASQWPLIFIAAIHSAFTSARSFGCMTSPGPIVSRRSAPRRMISQKRRLTRTNRPLARSTSEMPAVPVSNKAVSAASFSAKASTAA